MTRLQTIKAIEKYSARSGLKPTTICQYAMQNRKFYERLHTGYFHEVYAKRLLDWMDDNPPGSKQ